MSLTEMEKQTAELEKLVSRWTHWSARGNAQVLANLLDELNVRSKDEWRRLTGEELRFYQDLFPRKSGVPATVAWYALIKPLADVRSVNISLERRGEFTLCGGRMVFGGPSDGRFHYDASTPDISVAWRKVDRLLDDGIVPAAKAVGAEINAPTSEEIFLAELPGGTSDRLKDFSNAAQKSLAYDRKTAELWRGFVISAFRERAIIDPDQFVDWLAKEGWSRDTAMELTSRFYDQCALLSEYRDEVKAAW